MNIDIDQIDSLISSESLTDILTGLVNAASPTGEEHQAAEFLVKRLHRFGVQAERQDLDATQSNAFGVLPRSSDTQISGDSQNLLLYSPIDTVTSNCAAEDVPWVAPELRDDMKANAYVIDEHIYGLGAQNPKGHAACIVEAARVLKELDCPLDANLYFGFGGGGMPTNAREGMRADSGHGVGCQHMLDTHPDIECAIIAKSGWAVSWEEVGFLWIDVEVEGSHTYVGSRHLLPYSNAIGNASKLIIKLEDWFEQRAEEVATPFIKPQGVISFIESGWERMPAFTPASCRFRVDFRFGPYTDAKTEEQVFKDKLQEFAQELGIRCSHNVVVTIPATRTDPSTVIIKNGIRAWEATTGKQHTPLAFTSGGTDANILRAHGIPTARIGLPKAQLPDIDFQLGMNCVAIADLRKLTKLLVLAALDTCGRQSYG